MYCMHCGKQLDPSSRFCSACGATINGGPMAGAGAPFARTAQLVRPRQNRMIAGVCAGFAQHYGWDLNLVRILTALMIFFSAGGGLIAYIIAWVIIPEEPYGLPVKST
jgi:phage shock protein C